MALPEDYKGPSFEFGGERYPFDPTNLMGSEVKMMESRTGLSFIQYLEAMEKLSADALGFYLWWALQKAGKEPGKFSDFDYNYRDFLNGLDGFDQEEPDPTPTRAVKRASKKSSGGTRRSSRTTVTSPPTGS